MERTEVRLPWVEVWIENEPKGKYVCCRWESERESLMGWNQSVGAEMTIHSAVLSSLYQVNVISAILQAGC